MEGYDSAVVIRVAVSIWCLALEILHLNYASKAFYTEQGDLRMEWVTPLAHVQWGTWLLWPPSELQMEPGIMFICTHVYNVIRLESYSIWDRYIYIYSVGRVTNYELPIMNYFWITSIPDMQMMTVFSCTVLWCCSPFLF